MAISDLVYVLRYFNLTFHKHSFLGPQDFHAWLDSWKDYTPSSIEDMDGFFKVFILSKHLRLANVW